MNEDGYNPTLGGERFKLAANFKYEKFNQDQIAAVFKKISVGGNDQKTLRSRFKYLSYGEMEKVARHLGIDTDWFFSPPDEFDPGEFRRAIENAGKSDGKKPVIKNDGQDTKLQKPFKTPFMARAIPTDFCKRAEIQDNLKTAVLAQLDAKESKKADNSEGDSIYAPIVLSGSGGFGKTTIATALCHDEEIRRRFEDGVLWVELGENLKDPTEKIEGLINIIGGEGRVSMEMPILLQLNWQSSYQI